MQISTLHVAITHSKLELIRTERFRNVSRKINEQRENVLPQSLPLDY